MRRDFVRLRRESHHSAAFREIYRMKPSKLGHVWGMFGAGLGKRKGKSRASRLQANRKSTFKNRLAMYGSFDYAGNL